MRLPILLLLLSAVALAQSASSAPSHLGFDKNDYPGDAALPALRRSFEWTGYWLSTPPGAKSNSWQGKRAVLRAQGFGFALLYLAPEHAALAGKSTDVIEGRARANALAAATQAKAEGFAEGSVIFLDIEEGGALTREQSVYASTFLRRLDYLHFTPGAYVSGIAVPNGPGQTTTTARALRELRIRGLRLWVANDACPPSPGCRAQAALPVAKSGTAEAWMWQYAQTPRRPQFAGAACAKTYSADNRCYAPGTQVFVDMNVSRTADPSAPVR